MLSIRLTTIATHNRKLVNDPAPTEEDGRQSVPELTQ
jgi:hypothetical protein